MRNLGADITVTITKHWTPRCHLPHCNLEGGAGGGTPGQGRTPGQPATHAAEEMQPLPTERPPVPSAQPWCQGSSCLTGKMRRTLGAAKRPAAHPQLHGGGAASTTIHGGPGAHMQGTHARSSTLGPFFLNCWKEGRSQMTVKFMRKMAPTVLHSKANTKNGLLSFRRSQVTFPLCIQRNENIQTCLHKNGKLHPEQGPWRFCRCVPWI